MISDAPIVRESTVALQLFLLGTNGPGRQLK